jgi:triosephosphate isomerase
VVVCPPYNFVDIIGNKFSSDIGLGMQDFDENVSSSEMKKMGYKYVILGHSERRIGLGETDEIINKKIHIAKEFGLTSVLCVGDKSRESKDDIAEIATQLKEDLKNLTTQSVSNLIITYEPIWAISTMGGKVATIEDIKESINFIKKTLLEIFGDAATTIKILYGGSVNANNVKEIISVAGVEGLLIGQASLDPEEFLKIVEVVGKI